MPLQLKMYFENTSNCVFNTPGHCFILGQEVYWTLASKSIGIFINLYNALYAPLLLSFISEQTHPSFFYRLYHLLAISYKMEIMRIENLYSLFWTLLVVN